MQAASRVECCAAVRCITSSACQKQQMLICVKTLQPCAVQYGAIPPSEEAARGPEAMSAAAAAHDPVCSVPEAHSACARKQQTWSQGVVCRSGAGASLHEHSAEHSAQYLNSAAPRPAVSPDI